MRRVRLVVVAAWVAVLALMAPEVARAGTVVDPRPVTVPGSVLSSTGGGMTPEQWDSSLKAPQQSGKPYTVPGPAQSSGAGKVGVTGGSGALAGLIGLTFGLDVGSQIAYATGISDTGSWSCDLRIALGGDCGVGASPSYVVNSDLRSLTTSGWVGSPSVRLPVQTFTSTRDSRTVSASVTWAFRWVLEQEGVEGAAPAQWEYRPSMVLDDDSWYASQHKVLGRVWCRVVGREQVQDPTTKQYFSSGETFFWHNNSISAGVPIPRRALVSGSGAFCSIPGLAMDRLELWEMDTWAEWLGWNLHGGTSRVISTWYPRGHADRPPELDPNPQRWWRTSWLCESGRGGFAMSAAFHETDPEWPGFPEAGCDGSALAKIVIEQVTEGAAETLTIFEWETSPAFREWTASECARMSSPCYLDLQRISGTTAISCFTDPGLCVDWWAQSQHATNSSAYRCVYGSATLDLRECAVYARLFDDGVYADPATGQAPQAGSTPQPDPKPDPNPDPDPTPGTDPNPEPGAEPGPAQSDECPPPFSWTSLFNPWWYYKSSVCALQEVFVPTNSAAHMARINNALGQTTVALWAAEVEGMFATPPSASGCQGPAMSVNSFGINRTFYPFSACDAPMSTAAPWVRGVATGLVVVFGSMACVRALGAGFGWKPSAGGDS